MRRLLRDIAGRGGRRVAALALFGCAWAVAGCGPSATRDAPSGKPSYERSPEAPDPNAKFVHETYGIGASWYSYQSSTHALNPHPEWFRLELDDGTFAVHIESYYDERGESGFFTLKVRERGADGWRSSRTFEASSNVKETNVCVDLGRLRETACGEDSWHLVLRTDLRAVAGAGFAVSNPALYVRGHYSGAADDPAQIRSIGGEEPSGKELSATGVDLPSSRLDLSDSAVGPLRTNGGERRVRGWFYQATGDMQLVRWRVVEIREADGATELDLESACAELASQRDAQSLAPDPELTRRTLSIPSEANYEVSLVELCDDGPRVVKAETRPYEGRWPSTETYDLFVEQWSGRVALRLPPGHLVWNAGGALENTGRVDSADSLPGNLWGQ